MTVRVSAAIMAHPKRAGFVAELEGRLDREAALVWDDGSNSRWGTGRRALLSYDPEATHHLVVQDDAVVPRDLVAGLEQAIAHTSGDVPVCLYVGRVRPYRQLVDQYVARAGSGASWLVMDQLCWGVAIAFPTKIIEDMVAWCDRQTIPNYDTRMSRWLEGEGIATWYPWPSLVDHRESPSLVPGRGHAGRVARRFIGADASALDIDYSGSVLRLPGINDYRPGGHPMLFVSERYPSLSIPTIGARFQDGFFEATRRGQVSYLQRPDLRRRGVRVATDAEAAAWRDRRAAPATEPEPEGEPEGHEPEGETPEEPEKEEVEDETPPEGNAETVLGWVGDNPDRAELALAAEHGRDKPRSTLVAKLVALTGQ